MLCIVTYDTIFNNDEVLIRQGYNYTHIVATFLITTKIVVILETISKYEMCGTDARHDRVFNNSQIIIKHSYNH
jgi:hypothetical protein